MLAQARVDTTSFKHAVRVLHVAVGIRGAAQISTDPTGRIIVSARHYDAWARVTLDGASEQWGDAQLSLRSLISGVGNLPSGPLLIEQGSDMVRLAGGGREVLLDGSTFDIRIDTPVFDSSFWTWVNGLGFLEALYVVLPLVGVADDSDPWWGGVLFDQGDHGFLRMMGTDSYRLAVRDLLGVPPVGRESAAAKPLGRIARVLGAASEYGIGFHEGWFWVTSGNAIFGVKSTDGFPDMKRAMPSMSEASRTFSKGELLNMVDQIPSDDRRKYASIRLTFLPNGLQVAQAGIEDRNLGTVEAVGEVLDDGQRADRAVLLDNLRDCLDVLISDRVTLSFSVNHGSVTISDSEHEHAWSATVTANV